MFNSVVLVGRVGKDLELKKSNNDKSYCHLNVATNYGFGDKKRTDWHDVTVFGTQAENCCKFLQKGSIVTVRGRIQYETYEKDGKKNRSVSIIADEVVFMSSNHQGDGNQEPQQSVTEVTPSMQPVPIDPSVDVFGADGVTNDEIPF